MPGLTAYGVISKEVRTLHCAEVIPTLINTTGQVTLLLLVFSTRLRGMERVNGVPGLQ